MKPVKCYASIIGGCSNQQSYEHYVSKGLFIGKLITVQGQQWAEEPKTVGKSKIGLPILCTSHNTILSPIDSYAIEVFRILENCVIKQNERSKLPRSSLWRKDKYIINGIKFEKWMIKAAIGFTFENPHKKWHLENNELIDPPKEIVESLFERRKLSKPMGLYGLMSPGDGIAIEDRVSLEPLFHPKTKGYIGSSINFRNINFLIYFNKENISVYNFISQTKKAFNKINQPLFQPKEFKFNAKGKISSEIRFEWEDEIT